MNEDQLQALAIVIELADNYASEYSHCEEEKDWSQKIEVVKEYLSSQTYKEDHAL